VEVLDVAELISIKVGTSVPSGATGVVVFATSDGLNRVPGVRKAALDRAGFSGTVGAVAILDDGDRATVVAGLGPSDRVCTDELRRAAAEVARRVSRHRRIAVELPEVPGLDMAVIAGAISEGLLLGSYSFTEFRSSPDAGGRLQSASLVVDGSTAEVRQVRAAVEQAAVVADAVCFARDLVNTPGGTLTPQVFADLAQERALAAGLEVEVLDADAIAEAELGGLLAVNRGSTHPPRMVKLTYTPDPALEPTGDTLAFVGKGITFDSGGLSIKPADGMIGMKMDMGGAAAVIAAMCALPALGARTAAVSFTPMTDNMINGDAQRPGDVFTARGGTTVEVLNTDAEGRLILADALVLASETQPSAIVDLATLTGACMVALGDRIAGLMSNDDGFRDTVMRAAGVAGERVWPLPLPADYRKLLDSRVADISNISSARFGGTLTAGLFLQEFVADGIPWAHLDIAGPAMLDAPDGEQGPGATGFGVRTLVQLACGWGDVADADAGDEGELSD
jgi:leucyl aminopeptidase